MLWCVGIVLQGWSAVVCRDGPAGVECCGLCRDGPAGWSAVVCRDGPAGVECSGV